MRRAAALLWLAGIGACRFGFEDVPATETPDAPPSNVARVTVQHHGDGLGMVVGPNGFSCATGTCTLEVEPGTSLTLRGLASANGWFNGWTSMCGGNFDCTFDASGDMTIVADFTPVPNRVFVTSTTTDGAMGGLSGADAICAARATAAGLSGNFVAMLSDGATLGSSRVSSSRGWIRVDGAPYADAPTAFANGKILFPPRLDEYGNDIGNVPIFTGTNWGVVTPNRCLEWTSNLGTDKGGAAQTQYASSSVGAGDWACSTTGHLLCVETGRIEQVQTRPDTGKLAFSTKTGWVPGGGRASADALCANEASIAGLSGTFLAAVATTTESIASRFPPDQVYKRLDGVRLLRDAGFFDADWLDVPPELDQYGALIGSDLWTGASRFNQVPTAADNCNDWMDGTVGVKGQMHFTTRTDMRTPTKSDPCNEAVAILCLEQ